MPNIESQGVSQTQNPENEVLVRKIPHQVIKQTSLSCFDGSHFLANTDSEQDFNSFRGYRQKLPKPIKSNSRLGWN